jgi:hypothetical protein
MRPVALVHSQRQLQRIVTKGTRFLQKRPLLSKAIPTACGFAFGDLLTQHFNSGCSSVWHEYDLARTAKMGALGAAVAAPIGLVFLRYLDGVILPATPHSPAALGIKLTMDQVLGCALWQCAFLAVHEPYRAALLHFIESNAMVQLQQRPNMQL